MPGLGPTLNEEEIVLDKETEFIQLLVILKAISIRSGHSI